MAQWKVTRERLELFPHPNPAVERLELGKAGQYQVVVAKGSFANAATIIFVPEKSVLPDAIADQGDRRKYLVGPLKNRVKAIQLQKELSMGLILDDRPELADVPLGDDISQRLGITKYAPPIPDELTGEVVSLDEMGCEIHGHDVETYNIHAAEFIPGEPVLVTEKIHGTQGAYVRTRAGRRLVTSKGLLKNDQFFSDAATNAYKRAAEKIRLFELLDAHFPNVDAQAFGEVTPFQKGFNYGLTEATLFLYRIDVNGKTLPMSQVPAQFKAHWVPQLFDGPFDIDKIRPLREGKETVSGRQLHIREGCVVTPATPRESAHASQRFRLALKLINPKFVEDPDAIN
jgi:RNA ligase (TIGR02306 family)